MTRTLTLPEPIVEIFRQVERLERAYPGRKFTPDGHLIGSIGEVIAAEEFGLKLLPASAPGRVRPVNPTCCAGGCSVGLVKRRNARGAVRRAS